MKKLKNIVLQNFLDKLIDNLKLENSNRRYHDKKEIDIPFVISSLYQSFEYNTSKYRLFIDDLMEYPDYCILISDSKDDYNGILDVDIYLMKFVNYDINDFNNNIEPSYDYRLCFSYDERNYKYCECTSDMPDYREDKQCCGHGCDAAFCEFSLYKVLHITSDSWKGDEHDYWDFEDEFYLRDKELAEKKEKEDKERQIKELKNRIDVDQKRLAELESK